MFMLLLLKVRIYVKWESRRRRMPEFALQEEMQNRNQEGTIEAAKKKPATVLEEESAGWWLVSRLGL